MTTPGKPERVPDVGGAPRFRPIALYGDPRISCDSCGTHTGMDTHCCGRCAEDFNDPNREYGTRRINGRRRANGLPPLDADRKVIEDA